MREADRVEAFLSTGLSPEVALEESFRVSDETFAWVEGGVVMCVFGVGSHPDSPAWGIPWMIASDDLPLKARRFARHCREAIALFHKRYPHLINMVHQDHEKAIHWLRWCGFTFHAPIALPSNGAVFIPFTKEIP